MPFTLAVGFFGTLITALIAMLLPAIGVWFGGAFDTFIQRLTEVNMVLPGLAIAVLAYALLGVNMWIILGIVVMLNALGAPIKSFRSAFLQAKEAPYIDMARSYGASDFRIITRYLVPRILPMLIPYLVMQIPTFIFLEATLGFFNIRSVYPSWGRIIYEGLARGALYGSPFWVLEPIFLLLLTGLAFAMLGLALERILNPRVIADIPATEKTGRAKAVLERPGSDSKARRNRRLVISLVVSLLAVVIFTPAIQGKTLASIFMRYLDPPWISNTRIQNSAPLLLPTPRPTLTPTTTPVTPPSPTLPVTSTATRPASCIPGNPPATARVMEILDGNTVKVLMDGLVYVVRYIGVQAPLDDRNAFNAYLANSNLVFRKDVTLIADQVDRDPSGRLLRYMLVGDTFVNIQLLQDGQGMAVNDPSGYSCAEEFTAAESSAVQSARGMWAAATPLPKP
jgi:endonuclease YncB( thermonuclease family)